MKKLIYLFAFALILSACSSSQTIRETNNLIGGEWVLNSITHNQTGNFNITLFNDASKNCFQGSLWRFTPNNYRGSYSIDAPGCQVGDRRFIFSIEEVNAAAGHYDFLLKPIDDSGRPQTNTGFRLQLAQLSNDIMVLQQHLTVDGKPFTLNMNFIKY